MVKPSYGIRTPMVSHQLDQEITLQKDGVGLRPLPIKFVIITIASFCGMIYVFNSDLVAVGTGFQKVIFCALWLTMTVLLFFSGKTQLLNIRVLFSFIGYLVTPGNRKLQTRKIDENVVHNMLDISNIKKITDKGLITFADKDVGYMYRITGNASALLFETDQHLIINRVDSFYRRLNPGFEFIFMTLKEPQRIHNQAAAIKKRYESLTVQDPDLTNLVNNQITLLRDVVGKQLQSVHQYMIVKAPNEDALAAVKTDLQVELNQSTLFIRKCVPLGPNAIAEQLSVVFASPKIECDLDAIKTF
jgi:hypothetical protein